MQKIILTGNLCADPETRTTQNGVSVCSFTVAVARRFKADGQTVTDFYRCNAWRQLGEQCQKFLTKGRKVAVVGELQPHPYTAKDGTTRVSLDVSADEVEFLSNKSENATNQNLTNSLPGFSEIDENTLPF